LDNDAQKKQSQTNLLLFHIRTITNITLNGNGDIAYYCFVISPGLESSTHEIIEQKFNIGEYALLAKPDKYYLGSYEANIMALTCLISFIGGIPGKLEANGIRHHHSRLFTPLFLGSIC
jgi:hypothetical protein